MAGAYATGMDAATLHEVCYDDFVRGNPIGDYTFPSVSLIKGRRTRSMLRRRLGGREIQALPRQFRCMSVDLLGRAPIEHRSGDLVEAISASVSIPVLFPPMRFGDRLLVDGGVLDNLPVRLLTERDEGPIVAVNIAMGGGGGGCARTGPPRMPSMGDTLLRVMMIGSGGAVQSALDARCHRDHPTAARGGDPRVAPDGPRRRGGADGSPGAARRHGRSAHGGGRPGGRWSGVGRRTSRAVRAPAAGCRGRRRAGGRAPGRLADSQ